MDTSVASKAVFTLPNCRPVTTAMAWTIPSPGTISTRGAIDADAEAQHGAAHGQRQQPHGQHTDLHPGEESHAHINEQAEHHIHSNL